MGAFVILGLGDGHNAGAALVIDGQVVAAASEERFTRTKNKGGYPTHAVASCLAESGTKAEEITAVVYGGVSVHPLWAALQREELFSIDDFLKEQRLFWSRLPVGDERSYLGVLEEYVTAMMVEHGREDLGAALSRWKGSTFRNAVAEYSEVRRQRVVDQLGIEPARVLFVDHHLCHAAYGYWSSGPVGEKTLVLTMDASGDGVNATASLVQGGVFDECVRSNRCNVGRLYRAVTLRLGLRPDADEFKVMGLAPYAPAGETARANERLNPFYQSVSNGDFVENAPIPFERLYEQVALRTLGLRFDGLAQALQGYTERIVTDWAGALMQRYSATNVIFVGGVASNVKVAAKMALLPGLDTLHIPPGPGDESLPIGAALLGTEKIRARLQLPHTFIQSMKQVYLGPSEGYGEHALARLRGGGFEVRPLRVERAARDLSDGRIIGRCAGRAEFGPRALGNRSILVDPVDYARVGEVNRRVKNRDFWMPFAPLMLKRRAQDYLNVPPCVDPRYMTVACDVTDLCRRHAPAAIHPYDTTARPQVLDADDNPSLAGLLESFEALTGRGVLLNTSLNVHGMPIACDGSDAIGLLEAGHLDALIFGDMYVSRVAPQCDMTAFAADKR